MSKKCRQTSQQARAAQTIKTIRQLAERDDRHASALSYGTIDDWRQAWGYQTLAATDNRLQELQHAGLVWNDDGIWRREEDA